MTFKDFIENPAPIVIGYMLVIVIIATAFQPFLYKSSK